MEIRCKLWASFNLAILLLCCPATLVSTHSRVYACELHQFDAKHDQAGDTAPEPAHVEPVPAAPTEREGAFMPTGAKSTLHPDEQPGQRRTTTGKKTGAQWHPSNP